MSGSAIRTAPGPFSPLCGIPLPIEFPHNERIGDPGGPSPFPCAPRSPLWVIHNGRLGHPDASGAIPPLCVSHPPISPLRETPSVILSLSKDLSRAWRYKTCEPFVTSWALCDNGPQCVAPASCWHPEAAWKAALRIVVQGLDPRSRLPPGVLKGSLTICGCPNTAALRPQDTTPAPKSREQLQVAALSRLTSRQGGQAPCLTLVVPAGTVLAEGVGDVAVGVAGEPPK